MVNGKSNLKRGCVQTYLVAPEKGGIENKNPHFLVFLLRFLD
jgi:hypothetical protein